MKRDAELDVAATVAAEHGITVEEILEAEEFAQVLDRHPELKAHTFGVNRNLSDCEPEPAKIFHAEPREVTIRGGVFQFEAREVTIPGKVFHIERDSGPRMTQQVIHIEPTEQEPMPEQTIIHLEPTEQEPIKPILAMPREERKKQSKTTKSRN